MTDAFVFISTRSTPDLALPTQAGGNQEAFNRRIAQLFALLSRGHHTAGHLRLRPTADAINDHLLCDGSQISRTQFPELFAYLGTQYGEGDGSTTFNLPDYRDGTLTVPAETPAQTIDAGGVITVEGQIVSPPVNEGPTRGGNIRSGGRRPRIARDR